MPTQKINKADEIIRQLFKNQDQDYGLKEFETATILETLKITEEERGRFFVHDFISGQERIVFDGKKQRGKPEEIVRQLWLHKLHKTYKYPKERIAVEKSIHFGREIHAKAADIIVYKDDKVTPYIIFEVKSPKESKGIEQLKGYLNAEGAEIGVWSNGIKKVILYREYPKKIEIDTLPDIPPADKTIDDFLEEKKTYSRHTDKSLSLKDIVETMQELVLASWGGDVFNEVFKLIYAKLYDEREAKVNRADEEVLFRKYKDHGKTFRTISDLFENAVKKWPGVFDEHERIRLSPEHLSIVVGELEKARLFGSDLSIIDEAFEYLIPEVAKGKKGQYFTPRHVINMAVKMMNPKPNEYVIDPAAGSGGFLISTMYWVKDQHLGGRESAMQDFAHERIWGIDFADEISKVSRALMLIAGDGRSHMFKLNSLDSREWQGEDADLLNARAELQKHLLNLGSTQDNEENKKSFRYMDFDVLLTNPPFAGEIKDQGLLRQYFFGKKNNRIVNKIERHILFIERTLDLLKPGGRMAIVLPQGVLNNTNMEYVREYLFDKARILAVVGLHGNTFKPHTGTKTSVLFLQKWAKDEEPQKDYNIFMAVSKKAGKDNSGDYIYKKSADGSYVHDVKGKKVLAHDLDEIAEGFNDFVKKEKISFT